MAMDQQETFNWLVTEKARLEKERDEWRDRAFDLALKASLNNPAIREQIAKAKESEIVTPDVLNFVLR